MRSSGPCLTLIGLLLCSLVLVAEPLRAQEEDAAPIIATETRENGILTVTVEGVDGPLRDNVLAHLELNRFAGQAAPEESRMRWLHTRAETQIREALQPFGYYEPTIESTLNRIPNGWEARYRIQPGRPLRIATLDVQILGEGQQDPAFQQALDSLPLALGQILD